MVIQTTRFGQVQVQSDDILNFTEGILGFSDLKKFLLLDDPNDDIFVWLQSCEEPAIAFPVLEPELLTGQYKISLAKTDLEALKMDGSEKTLLFCIITIPEDPMQMTANLKAPVIINTNFKIGRQCVLQDNGFAIREPIFSKLQQRVFQNPNQSIKAQSKIQTQGFNVAVQLPAASPSDVEQSL